MSLCGLSLVATEEESKRMKSEMSEMKARHKVEMEQVTKDKESELNEIHDRYTLWQSVSYLL